MSTRGLVVGADGGNSKTEVVVADLSGQVVGTARGDGTVPGEVGMPATAAAVAALIGQAMHSGGLPHDVRLRAAAFHWANLDRRADESAAIRELGRLVDTDHLVVHNDTYAVLTAGAPDGWGIAVVSGAGINALGRRSDGRTARFLALGDVTGDWGGGGALGMAALAAAVRAGDGRGPQTCLREDVPRALGFERAEQVSMALANRHLTVARLADLAPIVAAAAEAGDDAAQAIVRRQADEIVTMVAALIRRLGLLRTPTPVILGGGTLQHGPSMLVPWIAEGLADVAPLTQPKLLDVRPVVGPVLEALELAGASRAARDRLRAAPELAS